MKQRGLMLLDKAGRMGDIAEALGVSSKSTRWEDNYEQFGRVDPTSVPRGRSRILNSMMTNDLRQPIEETPSLFLDEIGEWLAIYKVLRKVAAERDDVARVEWMHEIAANFTADQMVFLDARTTARCFGNMVDSRSSDALRIE